MSVESTQLELVGIAVESLQPQGAGAGAAVGRVDDAPEGAAALLGKRVLVGPVDPCGQCEVCRRGGAFVCPLAQRRELGPRMRVASRWLVALGDGLELPLPAAAAVAGDVTCAYTLYARTGLSPREPVVVFGGNAVARFVVEILRGKGITPTVVLDAERDTWRDWLLAKGAAAVSAASNDAELITTVTSAITAQGQGARPWRILVTDPAALPRAAVLAGPRATITALATGSLPALPGDLLAREVTVIGVAGPHPDLVVEAAALCVKGEIDLVGGVSSDGSDPSRTLVRAL